MRTLAASLLLVGLAVSTANAQSAASNNEAERAQALGHTETLISDRPESGIEPDRHPAGPQSAGSLTLTRVTIDAGGATTTAGGLRLTATVGQPEVGILSVGSLHLQAGFHRPLRLSEPVSDRIFSDRFQDGP